MSPKSAGLAKKAGYRNVKVMLEGIPGWTKAGYPVYASTGFVNKGNIVLIDLRSVEKSEISRIPRSVSIPYANLEDRIDDMPIKAPVVLYSDNEKQALSALKMLRKEGFKKVSLVYGDLDRWLKSEGNFDSGPVTTGIAWKRKPGKGEVSAAEFEKAVAGSPEIVILDVRTRDEAAEGKYPTAVNIPLDELTKRAAELPKDKKIYVHCTTGARAEMACRQLQKDGYNALFLVADVECEGNGCEIEE